MSVRKGASETTGGRSPAPESARRIRRASYCDAIGVRQPAAQASGRLAWAAVGVGSRVHLHLPAPAGPLVGLAPAPWSILGPSRCLPSRSCRRRQRALNTARSHAHEDTLGAQIQNLLPRDRSLAGGSRLTSGLVGSEPLACQRATFASVQDRPAPCRAPNGIEPRRGDSYALRTSRRRARENAT